MAAKTPPFKKIIHLDMDAFYAAVEALDKPGLKGLPVIVGGLGSRGVVSTSSYEARAYGVHSGMPMSTARRLCPNGVYIKPRHWRYKEISDIIMSVFERYTPLVEPLSLDEAFLDVTGSGRLFGSAEEIAIRIKAEVLAETGLTVTAGVASQKHLAKIASGMNKPDGLTVVPEGGEQAFLNPLPIKNIWGVGKIMLAKLKEMGLVTVGDLAALERETLEKKFGRHGRHLWELANGLDERAVEAEHLPKSIGSEETFAADLKIYDEIKAALLSQALTAVERMRHSGFMARTITVKFRDPGFVTKTRAITLPAPTDLRDDIYKAVLSIFKKETPSLGAIRLLGVSLNNLSFSGKEPPGSQAPVQRSLFDDIEPHPKQNNDKAQKLNQALDKVSGRFGAGALRPASVDRRNERDEN